jgi:hypothetical protein
MNDSADVFIIVLFLMFQFVQTITILGLFFRIDKFIVEKTP